MKTSVKSMAAAAVIASLTAAATLVTAQPAAAHDRFLFSFDVGDVRFAYSDGYWDRHNRWHHWRSPREAYEFQVRYGDRYGHWRYRNPPPGHGRRDRDGDGVPNRYDWYPNNPWRY